MAKIDVITTEEQLFGIANEWRDLLSKAKNNNIFLTFEWLSTWYRFYGGQKKLWVLVIKEEKSGSTLGIAPLVLSQRGTSPFLVNVIEFMGLGEVCSDHLDFIMMPGREKEVVSLVFTYLERHRSEWDVVNLERIVSHSFISEYLKNAAKNRYFLSEEIVAVCPYVTLSSTWDFYLTLLESKFKKRVLYYLRRIKRDFDFGFEIIKDVDKLKMTMERLFQLNERRWAHKGKTGSLSTPTLLSQFHRQIAPILLQKDWLRLYCLRLNDEIAGILYCFKYNYKIFYYNSGFDPSLAKYSLGTVLIACSIQHAISERIKEFDFLRGGELYKYNWTKDSRKNIRLQIINRSLRGFLYYLFTKVRLRFQGLERSSRTYIKKLLGKR